MEDAEKLFRQAAALEERHLGPDHPEVTVPLMNLAGVHMASERYADAEPVLARVLSIREQRLGADHPLTAASMARYAEVLRRMGRQHESARIASRAKAILARHAEDNMLGLSVEMSIRPKR
jgi:hypothetical protein